MNAATAAPAPLDEGSRRLKDRGAWGASRFPASVSTLRAAVAVARRELLAYALSPISYLVAALFLVVQGYSFFLVCQALSTQRASATAVMQYFFGGTFLYWLFLMFVVAVITMRLLAEERQRGTIEPLLTAPISEAAVVLGKYLGAVVFYLCLWAPTLFYVGLLRAYAGDAAAIDPGAIAAGYLGTLLVGLSALAIGLLASSLTRSQVLAAVMCFTALSLLLLSGMLADLYVRNETVRQVLLHTNLFRHMDELGRGIVDSRRVVYHLSLAAAAVFAAGRVLSARPGDSPAVFRVIAEGLLCLLLLVGVNLIAARHVYRADWTAGRLFTLSERTQDLLADVGREGKTVQVTVFQADNAADRNELLDDARELLLRVERAAAGKVHVELLDIDRDRDRVRLLGERYHIDKDDLRQGVMVVESQGRTRFLNIGELGDFETNPERPEPAGPAVPPRLLAFRGEELLDSAILTVVTGKTPVVCFTKGHGESEYDSFTGAGLSDLTESLRRENYQSRGLDQLALVPRDCDVVVIAGPERAFLADEAAALSRYLDGGGRMLLLLGPQLDRGLTRFLDSGLFDLLRVRGIRLGQAVVIDPEKRLGDSLAFVIDEGYGDHPVSAPMLHRRTLWTLARPVRALPTVPLPDGTLWSARDLVLTGDKAYQTSDLAALREGRPAPPVPGVPGGMEEGAEKSPISIAAAASVKETGPGPAGATPGPSADEGGRLVVLGCAQLGTNESMALYNRDLILGAISWLADAQRRVVVAPKRPAELRLVLKEDQLTRLFLLTMCGLPLMALLLGLGVFWIRRG